jgi:molybdate transport system ATP-binding protein
VPMVYVTHQPGEARVLAQEVVVLERGRVRARGPAAAVLAEPRASGMAAGEGWRNVLEGLLEREGGGWCLRGGGGLRLRVPDPEDAREGARAAYASRRATCCRRGWRGWTRGATGCWCGSPPAGRSGGRR